MMKYLKEGFRHIIQGNFSSFLKEEIAKYKHRQQYRVFCRKNQEWGRYCANKISIKPIQIQSGVRLQLYTDSELCRLIYLDRFEKKERDFLNRFLKKGDIFVDVGANIGLFTVAASKLVGKRGYVYAFEPCSQTYLRLKQNIHLNHCTNINSFCYALSHENAFLSLIMSIDGFDAWNSFGKPIAGQSFQTETVQAIRWDDFAKENKLVGNVTMMKIDVEGWESCVLKGGEAVFSRPDAPLLQVEFTEENCKNAGFSCQELYQSIKNFGYQMFLYDSEHITLIPEPLRDNYPYLNIIATKDPNSVAKRLRDGSI